MFSVGSGVLSNTQEPLQVSFSGPLPLGEASREDAHTLSWIHCSFSGNAGEGEDSLALSVDSIVFTAVALRYLVCIHM